MPRAHPVYEWIAYVHCPLEDCEIEGPRVQAKNIRKALIAVENLQCSGKAPRGLITHLEALNEIHPQETA